MSKKIYGFITSLLISAMAVATSPLSSAADECQGSQCQVTFSYSGSAQIWQVPIGASNITFDVQGAQGGRGGGLGGRITGSLIGNFTQLQIMVGGAGLSGMLANGGFNGGGKAGGNRTNEGSGGGASDIRTLSTLDSRLVVAGGGGGTGGYSGGPGGHGGGETANSGQNGQGGGGGGGGQATGGQPGGNNGGMVAATAGSFGNGGSGGTSWNAGGGGGGGGWFGGGGGGSDDDDCCGDGGGGGGGSSYAASGSTSSISHTTGYRSGNGVVIIRYELVPQLIKFEGQQLQRDTAVFNLEYNLPIQGLDVTDFLLDGTGCQISSFITSATARTIHVASCQVSPELILPPDSFTIFASEPAATLSATVNLDQTAPEVTFSTSASSQSSMLLEILVSDSVQSLATQSIAVSGCDINDVSTSPTIKLDLVSCREGVAEVVISGGALVDRFGNSTSTISHLISFDYSAPNVSWERPLISGTEEFEVRVVLISDEWLTASETAFQITGSAISCSHQTFLESNSLRLELRACSQGDLKIELTPGSIRDQLGNLGPATTMSLAVRLASLAPLTPAAPPAPTAPPVTVPAPSNEPPTQIEVPTEAPETEITLPEPQVSESDILIPAFPESISKAESAADEFQTEAQVDISDVTTNLTFEKVVASQAPEIEAVAAESNIEVRPVLLASNTDAPQDKRFWIGLLGVIVILSLGGLGAYGLHLAKNNRARTIK